MLLPDEIENPVLWPPSASTFLEACEEYAKSRWPKSESWNFDSRGFEELTLFFDPPERHGTLSLNHYGKWTRQRLAQSGDRNALTIRENGHVGHKLVGSKSPDGTWSEINTSNFFDLRVPEEIGEIMRWLEDKKADLKPFEFELLPMSGIVEGIYFLVEPEDQRPSLASYDQITKLYSPEIVRSAMLHAIDYLGINGIDEYFEQDRRIFDPLEKPSSVPGTTYSLRENDLIIGIIGELVTPRTYNTLSESSIDSLKLVIRPNYQKVSMAFIIDYLTIIGEGRWDLAYIICNIKTWRRQDEKARTRVPKSSQQLRYSLELRIEKLRLLNNVSENFPFPDSLQSAITETRLRNEAWEQVLKSPLLHQLEWLTCTLPYFLAWPYYNFKMSKTQADKCHLGKMLLNLTIKTLVFFNLKFLKNEIGLLRSQEGNEVNFKIDMDQVEAAITNIESQLHGRKPPADGGLVAIARELEQIFKDTGFHDSLFSVTSRNQKKSEKSERIFKILNDLVSLRNRLQHAPFDEIGFVKGCEMLFPELISELRDSFGFIKVLTPLCMKNVKGDNIVTALVIDGHDGRFRNIDFRTKLGIESFPTDELVAKPLSGDYFSLGTYFSVKLGAGGLHDIGVFDHTKKGIPVHHFIREYH